MSVENNPGNHQPEINKESAIEAVFLFLKEAKEREEKVEGEKLPQVMERLPKDLHSNIHEKFERLKGYGLSEEQLAYELKHEVKNVKAAYEDKRFEIPNGSYLRHVLRHILDIIVGNMADKKINLTKIRGLGVINFDVNGLKTVNDIIGHESGTEYLKRIVETLRIGKTTRDLESKGINVFLSSDGGDEFVIVLSDDVNLMQIENKETFINNALARYEAEVKDIDLSDIVDFTKPGVKEKFMDIEIPKDFQFTATISGGTACVEEVLIDDGFYPDTESGYSEMLGSIIASLFQISDRRGKANKNAFKNKLDESTDPKDMFLAMLLKRNIETALIEAENKRLKQMVEDLQKKA